MKITNMFRLFKKFDASDERVRCHLYEQLNLAHHKVITKEEKALLILDHDYNTSFYNIDRFLREIERTDNLPYHKNNRGLFVKNLRCKFICHGLTMISTWMQHRKADLCYSHYVELFYQTVIMTGYPYEYSNYPINAVLIGDMTVADFGNHLIDTLRGKMRGADFQLKVRRQQENSFRQFNSSVNYVSYLLKRHSRLLHVRVDLAYDRSLIESDEHGLSFIMDKFSQFRKLISRKDGCFEHLTGYIAHVEYGRLKGHHIHMSLFYNGHKRRQDEHIAHQVRAAWMKITNGIGLFYSTNLDKHIPICNAIGMIKRGDSDTFNCLAYVIWYQVKEDQNLTFKYSKMQRLYFRGEIHPSAAK